MTVGKNSFNNPEISLTNDTRHLLTALNSLGDCILIIDSKECITQINTCAESIIGLNSQQLRGEKIDTILNLTNHVTGEKEDPFKKALNKGKATNNTIYYALFGKKVLRHQILAHVAPLESEDKKINGAFMLFRIMSDENAIEKSLHDREAFLTQLFETIPDMISLQDQDMNIIYSNWKGFANIPGNKRKFGEKCYQVYRGYDEMCPDCQAIKALKSGISVNSEKQLPDGRWVEVRAIPVGSAKAGIKYFMEWVRDITDIKEKEKALNESRDHYKTVFENTGTATIIIEEDKTISMVNKKFTELYGASKAIIEGKMKWTEAVTEKDMAKMKEYHKARRTKDGKAPWNYEFIMIDAAGKRHHINATMAMIPNTTKSVASFLDVTRQRKSEQRLHDREKRLEHLFHKNSAVLMLIDPDTGGIVDVNDKAVQFYGYSRKQLCSMKIQQINILPEDHVRQEIQVALKGSKSYFVFTHRLADGSVRDVAIYPTKIKMQNKIFLYSTLHDITEDLKNKRRLQKGEEIARIGHWEFDFKTNRVVASEGAKKIYGIENYPMTIESIQQVSLEKDRPMMDKALEELMEKGTPYNIEFKISRPDNKEILDIHSIAEYDSKKNIVFGVIQDITKRKQFEKELKLKNEELIAAKEELRVSNEELKNINTRLEEQNLELIKAKKKAEESDRLKTAFLANMSHEVRTPMNGIMGFAQLLQENEFSKKEHDKFSDIIYSRTQHLHNLINDIIDVSLIESNQIKIEKKQFSLNEICHELYIIYKNELKKQEKENIKLKLNTGETYENSLIYSDAKRIRQILDNLLSNALKFTKEGEIEFGYKLTDNNQLTFHVRDTGIGMRKDKLELIFERFRQLDDARDRKYEGTGLGLTISKNLIELLQGKIWVESQVGRGTVFYFSLPVTNRETLYDIQEQNTGIRRFPDWEGKLILIVEDDQASIEYLREVFKNTNADVLIRSDGESGLKTFQENPHINLILMDIRLPDVNGLEIIQKMREHNTTIPIIVQTAYAMSADRKKSIKTGANDYIAKPIDVYDLLSIIGKYI